MKINYDRVINLHLISTAINVNTHALQIKCALFFFSLWLWYLLFLVNSLSTNWDTDYSNQTIISLGLTWFKFCDTFFKCLCKTGANRVCLIDVSNVRGSTVRGITHQSSTHADGPIYICTCPYHCFYGLLLFTCLSLGSQSRWCGNEDRYAVYTEGEGVEFTSRT